MQSHPGQVRELNEDIVVYHIPTARDPLASLGILAADAYGAGHAAGEVAARLLSRPLVFPMRPGR
jgi:hypothetical protein